VPGNGAGSKNENGDHCGCHGGHESSKIHQLSPMLIDRGAHGDERRHGNGNGSFTLPQEARRDEAREVTKL
jgi:hypothetical protein